MIGGLKSGEFVYVRMQVVSPVNDEFESALCCVHNPKTDVLRYIPVPKGLIVAREPEVMLADQGIVRAI